MSHSLPDHFPVDAPLLCDRRKQLRRQTVRDGTHVWTLDGRCIAVRMLDESEDGIGFTVPDSQSFEFGPRIDIEFDDRRRVATVVHIARQDDGSYRVGLQWLTE